MVRNWNDKWTTDFIIFILPDNSEKKTLHSEIMYLFSIELESCCFSRLSGKWSESKTINKKPVWPCKKSCTQVLYSDITEKPGYELLRLAQPRTPLRITEQLQRNLQIPYAHAFKKSFETL